MYIKKIKNRQTTTLIEGEVPYISFDKLEETGIVKNAFSTRLGGVSSGIYKSMNFSIKMGDDEKKVHENFRIFSEKTGLKNMIAGDQTHSVNVLYVEEKDIFNGIFSESKYKEIDGLITDKPGITLATFYADCVPLYFVDTKNNAIGLSHSGWRGTVNRMGYHTIEKMKKTFNTDPKDIIAAIGPSICRDCYEVSKDVADEFINEFGIKADKFLYPKADKYMLDLWEANVEVLIDAGVKRENITITDICTCCNKEVLLSHRATMGKRGNLGAFLMIKSGETLWRKKY